MKLLIATFLVINAVTASVGLRMAYKKRHPPLCDSCKNLLQKRGKDKAQWRYSCLRCGKYDTPPEICREYKPREGGADNG